MIDSFDGAYTWLSNFYPHVVFYDGINYPSAEHAFQAAKTLNAYDRALIKECPNPGKAKRMGREVTLRPNWEDIKVDIMYEVLREKFKRNPLKQKLMDTGTEELVEGNNWNDKEWGVVNGKGKNKLGKVLMRVREELIVASITAADDPIAILEDSSE